ncbi:MAG: hypothetical protein WCX71_00930 [Candidatus Buchananbacteria bacterium]
MSSHGSHKSRSRSGNLEYAGPGKSCGKKSKPKAKPTGGKPNKPTGGKPNKKK